MHYCVRSLATAPYIDVLKSLGARVKVYGESVGEVLDVVALIAELPHGSTIYHCGPAGLMANVEAATAGWDTDKVRSESFGGDVPVDRTTIVVSACGFHR